MVARALWRSEARRVVPWSETLRVQGGSQGTTLSASDLHNARATILDPFYNMEYKIITKIRQNTAWIEADILGTNLTPNRYNALAPAIVYVSDDVTIPFNSVTPQQQHKEPTASAREWDRNHFEIYGSALELISISLCTRANTSVFDSVYIKGNQIKLFQ